MKREPLTQIVLVIVGLLNLAIIYFLYTDLRHSSWLLDRKNEVEPMFLPSFFIPVGVFLLMAAKGRPSEHRFDDCSSELECSHLPWHGDGYSNRGGVDSRRPPELC